MMMGDIGIRVEETRQGWLCHVQVGKNETMTDHEVEVTRDYLEQIAPGSDPETLVRASFRFLLEREPQSAIMPAFGLPVVAHYFPEYEETIGKRV